MCQVEYKAMYDCGNDVRAVPQLLYKLQYHGMLSSTTSLYGVNKQANKLVSHLKRKKIEKLYVVKSSICKDIFFKRQ